MADLRDRLDRMGAGNIGQARMLIQAFDGGSMPTTVPAVFMGYPVSIDIAETEGATPTFTPDTSIAIPVLVIGPTVPVVGDLLQAITIGGRWVARKGGGGGEPGTVCGLACGACDPPVVLAYEGGTVEDSAGTHPLLSGPSLPSIWAGVADYGTDLIPTSVSVAHVDPDTFECVMVGGTVYHAWGFGCGETLAPILLAPTSIQCDPFGDCHAEYRRTDIGGIVVGAGFNGTAGEPSCDGGFLTVTASGYHRNASPGCVDHAPYPVTSGTFRMPLAVPKAQVCCGPCPIPKVDLTLTEWVDGVLAGTSTLVWNSSTDTWSDGTNTYHCEGGDTPILAYPAGTTGMACVTGSPYHVEGSFTGGGHTHEWAIDE